MKFPSHDTTISSRLSLQNVSALISKQCFFYDMNSDTPTNLWNGSQEMSLARENPLLVSMGDKVCT
jgi:hypothetical protein